MELRHLRYFRVVAQELNFRRAAERLFMEPQPLNFQIRQLERELGFRLFSHDQGKTQLTAAGETFAHDVETLLAATEQAVARAERVARGEAGTLRVGIPTAMAHALVAPAIKHFHQDHPDVSFSVLQLSHGEQLQALQHAQLDVGLGFMPHDEPLLDSRPLTLARPVVVVPVDHELAGLPVIPWSTLQGQDAVLLDPQHAAIARGWIDRILADHEVHVHEVQTASDFESAIAYAKYGFGLAIVVTPQGIQPERPGVAFVPLPPDAGTTEVGAIWLRDDANVLREKFVDALSATAAEVGMAAPAG